MIEAVFENPKGDGGMQRTKKSKKWDFLIIILAVLAAAAILKFFPPGGSKMSPPSTGEVAVHFIDVGQGDCELIQYMSTGILIDAGETPNGPKVAQYLKDAGITTLEYVVATHPHSDHYGGLAEVVKDFDVEHVLMPDVTSNDSSFQKLLEAIKAKGLKIETPKPGSALATAIGGLTLDVFAPNSASYSDTNEYSIVIKAAYGATSFLFTGDASSVSEAEMLKNGYDLSADVLKVGHHGSTTSTSQAFLDAVNPSLAVIEVGKDNPYGHPNAEILDRLNKYGVRVYRTDLNGTVTMVSDGAKITVSTEKK